MKYILLLILFTTQAWAQITYSETGTGTYTSTSDLLKHTTSGWDLHVRTDQEFAACNFEAIVTVPNVGNVMFGMSNGPLGVLVSVNPTYGIYQDTAGGGSYVTTDGTTFAGALDVPIPTGSGYTFKWSCSGGDLILEVDTGSGYVQHHNYGAPTLPVHFQWKPFEATTATDVQIVTYGVAGPSCGADNGGSFDTEPTNLCSTGTPSSVQNNGATWDWTCTQGTTVNCSATNTNPFKPFPPSAPAPDAIVNKGGLLTSNGSNQIEKAPCSNGQIIEWDSTDPFGFKCVAKPAGAPANQTCSAHIGSNGGTSSEVGECSGWTATDSTDGLTVITFTSPSASWTKYNCVCTAEMDGFFPAFVCEVDHKGVAAGVVSIDTHTFRLDTGITVDEEVTVICHGSL